MTQQPSQPVSRQSSFWARNIWAVILSVLIGVVLVLLLLAHIGTGRTLAGQEARIAYLQRQVDTARRTQTHAQDTSVATALGITPARLDADAPVISDLVRTTLTWDSGRSYARARDSVLRRYRISPKGQFMTALLPPPAMRRDASGRSYYYIDSTGANSAVDGQDTQVVGARGTDYTYLVEARARVSADHVTGSEAIREVLIRLTVDADGNVTDVSGYTAGGGTRASN